MSRYRRDIATVCMFVLIAVAVWFFAVAEYHRGAGDAWARLGAWLRELDTLPVEDEPAPADGGDA